MTSDRRNAAPYVVLGLFILITAIATKYVWDSSRMADEAQFDLAVRTTVDSVSDRIEVYSNVLRAAAGLFAAQQDVTRDQFRAYVRQLQIDRRYPGILGIGVSVRVKPDMVDAVVSDMRANDFPDFKIWPDYPRDEYHTIVVLQPLSRRNRAAIGYDMHTNPVRRAAMDRARDTGEPAASGAVTLVQEIDPDKQPGFLLYVPIYTTQDTPPNVGERRDYLYGFIYGAFRAVDLLRGAFADGLPRDFVFDVRDGRDALFMSDRAGFPARPRFATVRRLQVAGRVWTLRFASRQERPAAPLRNALGTLTAGLLLSFLIFSLLRAQLAARAEAERAADTLKKSETELLAASRAKDEFLATLSHELRTPMTAIIGWAQLLAEPLDPEARELAIDAIQKSGRAQAQLIDDLLDVSRITSGKMRIDPRPMDLTAAISGAIGAVAPAAEAKNVEIDFRAPSQAARVNGDSSRLQQVFWNLLTNAVKFTPKDGVVRVEERFDGADVVVSVTDSGEGIDAEFLPHVFERFRQADSSTTRNYAGLGLGLSIVRHLTELHGGSVTAASEGKGKGATFTVRLPLLNARAAMRDSELLDDDTLAVLVDAKVLVVDDEEVIRKYAETVFSTAGSDVRCAGSAAEAMRMLEQWRPDVVLTDIGMPGTDGYALLRLIRATIDVRVLALTAYARPEDQERVERAGFDGFVAKPVEPKQLRAAVAAALAVGPKPEA